MYQPKIKDPLIRKLYFKAKRDGKRMTEAINEALEEYLTGEPEPPIEGRKDVRKVDYALRGSTSEQGTVDAD